MIETAECINTIVESKLSREGYDADEENSLLDILNLIGFSKLFEKDFKNHANNWILELTKPSRRFKKITESDLTINIAAPIVTVIEPPKTNNYEFDWSEYEEYKKLQTKSL
jgi:chromodomain-helicase-DNA-binding protein 7